MSDSIKEKIKSLLAKAACEASTENEAIAAMQAAKKLMIKHKFSEADVSTSEIVRQGITLKGRAKDVGSELQSAISLYTNTYGLIQKHSQYSQTFSFCGRSTDVVFAVYLLEMLTSVIERWSKNYEVEDTYAKHRAEIKRALAELDIDIDEDDRELARVFPELALREKKQRQSQKGNRVAKARLEYARGVAEAVCDRLYDLCPDEDARDDDDALNEYMLKFGEGRSRRKKATLSEHRFQGLSDGEKVNLNRPLNEGGGRAVKQLGA